MTLPAKPIMTRSVFETELGWMALCRLGPVVCELTFAHASRTATLAALRTEPASASDSLDVSPEDDELVARLTAYARGEPVDFRDVPVRMDDWTPFRRAVVEACRAIPFGRTRTYGELAASIGRAGAARAVGQCMATNRVPLIVPCHRVLGASGRLVGFTAPGGLELKRRLLRMEGSTS